MRLAAAGPCAVSARARGATLNALREHGWRLHQGDALLQAPAPATSDARDLGAQDLVVIALKGPAFTSAVQGTAPLLGPDTAVRPPARALR